MFRMAVFAFLALASCAPPGSAPAQPVDVDDAQMPTVDLPREIPPDEQTERLDLRTQLAGEIHDRVDFTECGRTWLERGGRGGEIALQLRWQPTRTGELVVDDVESVAADTTAPEYVDCLASALLGFAVDVGGKVGQVTSFYSVRASCANEDSASRDGDGVIPLRGARPRGAGEPDSLGCVGCVYVPGYGLQCSAWGGPFCYCFSVGGRCYPEGSCTMYGCQ